MSTFKFIDLNHKNSSKMSFFYFNLQIFVYLFNFVHDMEEFCFNFLRQGLFKEQKYAHYIPHAPFIVKS